MSTRFRAWIVAGVAAACAVCAPRPAAAFSTRMHIAIANEVRKAVIASGDGSIALSLGRGVVVLSPADAKAIVEQPLAFRAGAIGPDNMAFPGMTDPSHAIEQDPFGQCELLYQAALTDEERAYAIGCFLHGSTDAIAHHYVNAMSGETFTLTPITSARTQSWTNVVRHIVAESMIQDSAFAKVPAAFGAGSLAHAIPKGFVQRAYLDTTSPLWQRMAKIAKAKFDAARAKNPTASLATVLGASGLAPAEHLVLTPVYLAEIEASRQKIRADVAAAIAAMQSPATVDGAKLRPTAGADGKLGTYDDKTACSATCAALYAKYFVYVGLLAPRKDASGAPLPSALDKISDKLRDDLRLFLPAYLQTVENLSARLNTPLVAGKDGFDISKADVANAFAPMRDWSDAITTIDYEAVSQAVVPTWLTDLQDLLQTAGVSIRVPDVVAALLQPVVQPVKDAVKGYVIDQAQTYVETLTTQYRALLPGTKAEYQGRLAAVAPPGLPGTFLDHVWTSGLYYHSFNIAAAALAKHELVLPVGEVGPSSFDASHTPAWMQPGLCDYLRSSIFPLGIDVRALVTVDEGGKRYTALPIEDSPVECHDGTLSAFTTGPDARTCALVGLDALLVSRVGSVSRAYPPGFAADKPACRNLVVDGLPPPPPPAHDAGPIDDAGEPPDAGPDAGSDEALPDAGPEAGSGCQCVTPRGGSGSGSGSSDATAPAALGLALLAAGIVRRSRRGLGVMGALGALGMLGVSGVIGVIGVIGCGGGGADAIDPGAGAQDDALDPDASDASDAPADDTAGDAVADAGDAKPDAPSAASKLLAALGDSVWNGLAMRDGRQRGLELRFRASTLEWAEIQNPYGPARNRELRVFSVDPDGATVRSTVLSPAGWPPNPDNGRRDTWTLQIVAGTPRTLKLTRAGGATETYVEGAFAKPTSGLTATVSAFSSTGATANAFCASGSFSTIDHQAIWDFARGKSTEKALGTDTVAGARLLTWADPSGKSFAVTDIDGFRQLGGTLLSDQFNFVVRYVGMIKHPGGDFSMRELNDDVEGAVWAFAGVGRVGSNALSDLFLEVHSKAASDATADEPLATVSAGNVPIEILVLRCAKSLASNTYDVQIRLGTGAFQLVGDAPSTPTIDDTLFPPAL